MNKHGFIPDEFDPKDYVFGAGNIAQDEVLIPDGDWMKHLPEIEYQRQGGIESMACTIFGTLNALEMIIHRKYGIRVNYAERFNAILADITRSGGSPKTAAQTIRKNGVVSQEHLPFNDSITSWDDFYSPKPMAQKYLEMGTEWLRYNNFEYDWVFTPDHDMSPGEKMTVLNDALMYSPIGVSVRAWRKEGDVYVKDEGTGDNHWCVLIRFKGAHPVVFDSYDATVKVLQPGYDFQFAMRYIVTRRPKPTEEPDYEEGVFTWLWNMVKRLIHRITS